MYKKGEKLEVTKVGRGWDAAKMAYVNEVDQVEIKKVLRRNGKTFLKVWSYLGHGYTIVLEELTEKTIIRKV